METHHHCHDDHGHIGHHHDRSVANIQLAFFLNLSFAVIEIVGGLLTGSLAILADAVHDLGDSLSLGIALVLQRFSRRTRTTLYTYGYGRLSLLSALISGMIILIGSTLILWESVPRLLTPGKPPPHGLGMLAFAVVGVFVNGLAAYRLSRGQTQNEKVLTWHLVEDILGWGAVLVGSIVIMLTGWSWVDPLLAAGLSVFIMVNVVRHLWHTVELFLQRTPKDFDSAKFRDEVKSIPGVRGIHDLHAWSIDGARNILSLHLVVQESPGNFQAIYNVKNSVREIACQFGSYHTTVEVELEGYDCTDDCESED